MELVLRTCAVRALRAGDARALARHADNRKVWINLRDRFPHPYSLADAQLFIRTMRRQRPQTAFAIAVEGEAVGVIGVVPQGDVDRVSAEIGYWVGEAHWGRGIASEAVAAFTARAVREYHLTRLFARCFEYNAASVRVLEKAGYVLEARLRRSAIKDGRIVDQLQYAFIVDRTVQESPS